MPEGLPTRLLALALALLAGVLVVVAIRDAGGTPDSSRTVVPVPPAARGEVEPFPDPFVYDPGERASFERRAAAGASHGLYVFSPAGRRPAPPGPPGGAR